MDGEYVIDVAEYGDSPDGTTEVSYFQLKHSTLRLLKNLTFTDAKQTLSGFAARFKAAKKEKRGKQKSGSFTLVTNRIISPQLKTGIELIGSGKKATPALQANLEKCTKLLGEELRTFCNALKLIDGEGDYISQKQKLHGEMTEFIAGFVDNPEIDHLVALVSERALPHITPGRNKGEIFPEDVLKQVAGKSARGLFPAPPEFEKLQGIVPREQHVALIEKVIDSNTPVIIHAAGGVGKSVLARQFMVDLPNASLAITYDCFGGGKYRNESTPRHRPCDAFVQIANELAKVGLCSPLIGHSGTAREALFQEFIERLRQATKTQREINSKAKVIIVIDAGDNAEMAAEERGEPSFVKALLREPLPLHSQLVVLCRTERIGYLDPPSAVVRLALKPFNKAETAAHVRQSFPDASNNEIEEFHRLTSGNPRVQANALSIRDRTFPEVLTKLGPEGTSLDDQISAQLEAAISNLRDKNPKQANVQMDAICHGLANLPPFIPIAVLAAVAKVDESAIHSFVSDMGRPLWHSDNAVQFRDEPTETWFRKRFSAEPSQIKAFVTLLEPFASQYTYVAKALPRLLLLSGDLKRLVTLALSDDLLPQDNPIDQRDVRVYRLQFAFRAALKLQRMADAARLAFRAGEEMAGNQRQIDLLGQNIDLIAPLQDAQKVEELAYGAKLRGAWLGSDNVYSASLLSAISDFRGEAQGRLRAARRWLHIYIEERNKKAKKPKKARHFGPPEDKIHHSDILELVWTQYNLYGAKEATRYLLSWRPPETAFTVGRSFIRRLVDAAKLTDLGEIAKAGSKSPHLMVALADEISAIGIFSAQRYLNRALNALLRPKTRIKRPEAFSYHDIITPAILSFAEACAARKIPKKKILSLLGHYTTPFADSRVAEGYNELPRTIFVRAAALRAVLEKDYDPSLQGICFPKPKPDFKLTYEGEQRQKEMVEVVGALMPWYVTRARLISGDKTVVSVDLNVIRTKAKSALYGRYQTTDIIGYEMSFAWFKVLALKTGATQAELDFFTQKAIQRADRKFKFPDRLEALRASIRLPHLTALREPLEISCRATMQGPGESQEENSGYFVALARAVLPQSRGDASVYFDSAVEAVSKFGDEMVNRWEAVVSVARRAALSKSDQRDLTYRLIRCAEMIGDHVAREKYWDRDDVFNVAVRLHAPTAFAGLSRWRDRAVGYFPRQLAELASEAIKSGAINPASGWCLTGFFGCSGSVEFAATCIRAESSKSDRQRLLEMVTDDLVLNGAELQKWVELREIAVEQQLNQTRLATLIADLESNAPAEPARRQYSSDLVRKETEEAKAIYRKQLSGVDLLNRAELDRVVAEQAESEPPREFEEFWNEIVRQVPRGKEQQFLQVLLAASNVRTFDIGYAVHAIRAAWRNRIAVAHKWNSFILNVGKRYANDFSDRNHLSYWLQMHPMDEEGVKAFTDGIRLGLSEQLELSNAGTFFGFIVGAAEKLKPEEARGLLDFSLSRFELHMAPEFGDGQWAEWLKPPRTNSGALTGLIWSALGSPYSSMRWQAAHAVQNLARNECHEEVTALMTWMQSEKADAFVGKDLPFYNLHAQLYLLISLARVSLDSPKILRRHAKAFAEMAIGGFPHALIQCFAAKIAATLLQKYPNIYSTSIKSKLSKVGESPFPARSQDRHHEVYDTPRHTAGTVDTSLTLSFGIDFEPYWFKPLARVFGTTEEQVTQLIREVALNELQIPRGEGYTRDPRQKQWKDLGYNNKGTTQHSGGSYPYVDDYRFYYSYHSMMSVAMRLLRSMPTVSDLSWDRGNPWLYWVKRHLLTRSDGKWLADRRDPTPLKRREWTRTSSDDNWRWQVKSEDFLEVLTRQNPTGYPVCVRGRWSDFRGDHVEEIQISSAFVASDLAESLASNLRICKDPRDFYLPSYEEDEFEYNGISSEVLGWLFRGESSDPRLDGFDPFARDIFYPPLEIGASFAEGLGLTCDSEKRIWRTPDAKGCLLSELWSDEDISEKEKLFRFGKRLSATVPFLRTICEQQGKMLIFDVRIEREIHRSYRSSSDDEMRYLPPCHKIFTLSPDGVLRDGNKTYNL